MLLILSILYSLLLTKGSSNCYVSITSRFKMRKNPFSEYSPYITIDDETAGLPCLPAQAFSKYGEVKVKATFTCLVFSCMSHLTHLLLDKIAAISQTIVSNVFFNEKNHWSLFFLRGCLTKPQHWINNDFAPNKRHAIIWTNAGPIHWRTYAVLDGGGGGGGAGD